MSELERAKLIPISGNNDTPDMDNAVDVQFNPVTLRVSLSNTLRANASQGNSRAAQFVDKSSSSLTVELIFDTTYIESSSGSGGDGGSGQNSGNSIVQGSDVRIQTRKIADKFLKPVESGSRMQAPSRVLFQWGSFEFKGMVQSYDETLDFFSPAGRPLRATVSLKLNEDRYQFHSDETPGQPRGGDPALNFTGNGANAAEPGGGSDAGNGAPAPNQNVSPVPGSSREGAGGWRENALFNGIESPRLPAAAALALPTVGLSATGGFGISGGAGIGVSASLGASGGVSVSAGLSASAGVSGGAAAQTGTGPAAGGFAASTAATTSPAFKYGNSSALGTGIPGAFSPSNQASLKASSLQQGSLRLRAETVTGNAGGSAPGRTASGATSHSAREREAGRSGLSVAALLKEAPDSGVGFD